jgi:hypothetical protein
LGYDLNTVEFAIKDGVPYAIDFMNPAPDAELASVGDFYHNWIVNAVSDLIFKRLGQPQERPRYRWDAFLNPEPVRTMAVASSAEQQERTISRPAGEPFEGEKAKLASAADATSSSKPTRRGKSEGDGSVKRAGKGPSPSRPRKM